MRARTFDELLSRIKNYLEKSDTNMRATIELEEMLAINISTMPEENIIIQERESQIPQVTDVNCPPIWLAPLKDITKL
jgi:hypothetical protein